MRTGKVYLVGAGPGDPGLISQKGLECIRQAEVVIYDYLLDKRLLDAVSPQAERIYVGKSRGQQTREQNEINQLLVGKAKDGKNIVRLKGGDPFVLGRGGEEADDLRKYHIPFEIVPGVTSAVAVPAYAGIPVTYRGVASSFAVITGQEDPKKINPGIAWEKLATGVDTLVFLMGMQNLPKIVAALIKHGRLSDTPVAVIKNGTRPEQTTIVGNLKDIVAKVSGQYFSPPVVIVVGEVVRFREKLRWFDNRPLFGKRILVTRARRQAVTLSKLLSDHGARPIVLPAIDIKSITDMGKLDRAILNLGGYQWLVFTSINGVEAFFDRLYCLNLDTRALNGLNIGSIGPATAQALYMRGIVVDYIPEVYTAEGLVNGLKRWDVVGKRFLLPRTDIPDRELEMGFTKLGADVHEIVAYRTISTSSTISQTRQMLESGEIDVITFTSSSTVTNLVAAFKDDLSAINGATIACIGPKTADTAARSGLKVSVVAREHTIRGLVEAIEQYFNKEN